MAQTLPGDGVVIAGLEDTEGPKEALEARLIGSDSAILSGAGNTAGVESCVGANPTFGLSV